ncbi:MAG: hypothetical protein V8Q41_08385 [Anaerostipes hadrus]
MFQSDFGIIADYFVKRRKGYKTIENHKQIKHVDEMLKFMKVEDERFLKLNLEKKKKGANYNVYNIRCMQKKEVSYS